MHRLTASVIPPSHGLQTGMDGSRKTEQAAPGAGMSCDVASYITFEGESTMMTGNLD